MASYNFKVILLGQGCVGKTSLVLRFVADKFNESHQSTIQANFLRKQLYLDQDLVQLSIWDTAGQEKFQALAPIYYREVDGALLVYDVTSGDSLRKVRDWVGELKRTLKDQDICLAIIGNKSDLLKGGVLVQCSNEIVQEAVQLADKLQNAHHYFTSARLSQGIGELFVSLSRRMIEQHKRTAAQRHDSRLLLASSRLARPIGSDDGQTNGLRVIDRSNKSFNAKEHNSCQC